MHQVFVIGTAINQLGTSASIITIYCLRLIVVVENNEML